MVLEFSCSELNVEAKFICSYRLLSSINILSCHTRFMRGTATLYKYHARLYIRKITHAINNIYDAYNIIFNNYTTSPSFLRAGQVDYRS